MARPVKRLLPNAETEIFRNWNDLPDSLVIAKNITLCNTSPSAVKVYLSFVVLSGIFLNGAVLNGLELSGNETRTIEITERVLAMDDSIRAYADTGGVVTLSIDLIGVKGQDIEIIP